MKIYGFANCIYRKPDARNLANKAADTYKTGYRAASKVDCVEISSSAYEAYANDGKLTATSGKDTLGITRGSKKGSFEISFSDSAMVSRAVSRGYITINGTDVELTDDIKQQLTRMDQQSQAAREKAYNKYIMQRNVATAQQQSDVLKKTTEEMTKAFETASKISSGHRVSPAAERQLLEFNPELYTMSKLTALLAKRQQKEDEENVEKTENNKDTNQSAESVEQPSSEWKSSETRLTVSLPDTEPLQEVSESGIDTKA